MRFTKLRRVAARTNRTSRGHGSYASFTTFWRRCCITCLPEAFVSKHFIDCTQVVHSLVMIVYSVLSTSLQSFFDETSTANAKS